jgi:hypothetical protein
MRYFSCKTISLATSFLTVFSAFVLRILSRISQHMSNLWTRALSDASRLTIVQNLLSEQLIDTTAVSLPPKSMTLTSYRICGWLMQLGAKWTPRQSGNAGAEAEKWVKHALDELESTGVLQTHNRMDIDGLLNPVGKDQDLDNVTDEEICQAVLDAHKAREEADINGGDDGTDDIAPVEPRPTRREVLQAASVISRYPAYVDDPVARKLETVLASFGRQMRLEESRGMVPTRLTSYFTRK